MAMREGRVAAMISSQTLSNGSLSIFFPQITLILLQIHSFIIILNVTACEWPRLFPSAFDMILRLFQYL